MLPERLPVGPHPSKYSGGMPDSLSATPQRGPRWRAAGLEGMGVSLLSSGMNFGEIPGELTVLPELYQQKHCSFERKGMGTEPNEKRSLHPQHSTSRKQTEKKKSTQLQTHTTFIKKERSVRRQSRKPREGSQEPWRLFQAL